MKETYYFSHDCDAKSDFKIKKMMNKYGIAGYGLYWIIVEILAEQKENMLELSDLNYKTIASYMPSTTIFIKDLLKINGKNNEILVKKFIEDCIKEFDLFSSDEKHFWSNSLIDRIKLRKLKSEAGKKGNIIRQQKEKSADSKSKKVLSAPADSSDENSADSKGEGGADSKTEGGADSIKIKENKNKEKEKEKEEKENKTKEKEKPEHSPKGECLPTPSELPPPTQNETIIEPVPKDKILELYHKYCKGLPQVRKLSPTDEKQLHARWRENPDLSAWEEFFKKVASSDFLTGKNDRGWRANFHWLIRPSNFVKVCNGVYDNEYCRRDRTKKGLNLKKFADEMKNKEVHQFVGFGKEEEEKNDEEQKEEE